MELSIPKCSNCSGRLDWSVATQSLKCRSCNSTQSIEPATEALAEFNQEFAITTASIENSSSSLMAIDATGYKCTSCGSITKTAEEEMDTECFFCGSHLEILPSNEDRTIKPACIIPRLIEEKAAHKSAEEWSSRQFMGPIGFAAKVKEIKLRPVYVPIWAFDYKAVLDFTYKVKHTEGSGNNTKTVMKTYTGRTTADVDDIAVYGASGYMDTIIQDAFPFPADSYRAFDPAYFTGSTIELNQMEIPEALNRFHQKLAKHAVLLMTRASSFAAYGFDIKSKTVTRQTYKHMYVPMYLGGYRFGKAYYPIVVNAVTGEVSGKAPLSLLKILVPAFIGFNLLPLIGLALAGTDWITKIYSKYLKDFF